MAAHWFKWHFETLPISFVSKIVENHSDRGFFHFTCDDKNLMIKSPLSDSWSWNSMRRIAQPSFLLNHRHMSIHEMAGLWEQTGLEISHVWTEIPLKYSPQFLFWLRWEISQPQHSSLAAKLCNSHGICPSCPDKDQLAYSLEKTSQELVSPGTVCPGENHIINWVIWIGSGKRSIWVNGR